MRPCEVARRCGGIGDALLLAGRRPRRPRIEFHDRIVEQRRIGIRRWPREVDVTAKSGLRREEIGGAAESRSEEHTSELQSLMRISYAVFCLKKKKITKPSRSHITIR